MTDKFKNKYRIPSARAQWWDYSNTGVYFITLCAYRHELLFGKISSVPGKKPTLRESPIGAIVFHEWRKSFEIRTELFCDVFVLMPNHLHAILRIENIGLKAHGRVVKPTTGKNPIAGVAYRPPKSISSFLAGFKSAATKKINVLRNTPGAPVWQPRFHDHIIRNMTEYQYIANYIKNNPANWPGDRFINI